MREYCCEVVAGDHDVLVAEYSAAKRCAIAQAATAVADIPAEPETVYTAMVYREGMTRDLHPYPATEAKADTPQVAVAKLMATTKGT